MKIKDKILSETSEEVKQRVRDTANKLVMKQETLEEAAERISPIQQVINFITENFQKEGEPRQLSIDLLKKWCEVKLLNEESKWQQERSYSEDEVLNKLTHFAVEIQRQNKKGVFPLRIKEWFERNKKK